MPATKRQVDFPVEVQKAREDAQDAVDSLSHACELQTALFYAPGDAYEHEAVNLMMKKAFELTEDLRLGKIKPLTT